MTNKGTATKNTASPSATTKAEADTEVQKGYTTSSLSIIKRSHYCGEVSENEIGQTISLSGWVNRRRDHGGVIFIDLRDHSGIVQIVFKPDTDHVLHQQAGTLRNEYVLGGLGKVVMREDENHNPNLFTGKIEVLIEQMVIYNPSIPPKFELDGTVDEMLRMTNRYYDLRRDSLQRNLRIRSQAGHMVRSFFFEHRFVEIETPTLTKATPEGARDYLVPSRVNPGEFYALPQSPQLFKQLLMVGGLDRYFQIARCYRDEDLRGNRQPEFTQIDVELSFTEEDEVIDLISKLLQRLFSTLLKIDVPLPMPRLSWAEAMEKYGTDAPDLRFDLPIVDLSSSVAHSGFAVFSDAVQKGQFVRAIRVPGGASLSRREIDIATEVATQFGAKGMAWIKYDGQEWKSPIAKFIDDELKAKINSQLGLNAGDLAVFSVDSYAKTCAVLAILRIHFAKKLNLIDESLYRFVWITDFPLLERSDDGKLTAMHHPFTMPVEDDLLKQSDPTRIRSRAYDIVLNGVELGGGSIRNHRSDLQAKVFDLIGLSSTEAKEKFGFLLEALQSGAPPHGGIALGFDRIIMFLVNTQSIRDVIAFPKTQRAADLMTQAPAPVSDEQLAELHIKSVLPPAHKPKHSD